MLYTESISPELRLEADYEMSGRILLLPIQGKGPCNITLSKSFTFCSKVNVKVTLML